MAGMPPVAFSRSLQELMRRIRNGRAVIEFVHEYAQVVEGSDGLWYVARVYASHWASHRARGSWEGWFAFLPLSGGAPLTTGRETSQSKREDLVYWVSGITPVYLQGALRRARDRRYQAGRVTPERAPVHARTSAAPASRAEATILALGVGAATARAGMGPVLERGGLASPGASEAWPRTISPAPGRRGARPGPRLVSGAGPRAGRLLCPRGCTFHRRRRARRPGDADLYPCPYQADRVCRLTTVGRGRA